MHCDEVIRELTVPTEEGDSAALAEHLAGCPACAALAPEFAALDRVWEATRPSEPSSGVWDAVWGRIAASLDVSAAHGFGPLAPALASQNGSAEEVPVLPSADALRSSRRHRRIWVFLGLVGLAQAAAVLFAVGLAWHGFRPSNSPQLAQSDKSTPSTSDSQLRDRPGSAPSIPTVEVEEGSLVVIVIPPVREQPIVVDRTPEWMSFGVDDWYLVYNTVEALANPVVAMKE
jgi:hypothetical protein